ncbi:MULTISPECIES: HAD family hydrolase [Rhizobium]|uniref:HAD family phosphatase n=1 Tax=Rhizobium rhododendri TaxID=2506430 RepID=A0ABY8IJ31_9HYPH|nr:MULTISPECIES: HAD family phosphatase [Rhizobium]MBZ5761102.1 HAD family phosphatase [Rhizobium sp. VS19-DR96]MBZ5767210.1 HAD family phosphatase [Rhizobium sp. VS19-DR129.2]MBZ5773501.1 HAD family phosphatase [Rhizobium sp. VS19-DRK62.2]MBZ5785522.1 HAD family phosphatase [Rhizobium sp. VS19-DR121]MBZ5802343.1 HAD family phosphatase [Rhizobium sp. VS19-DR181]
MTPQIQHIVFDIGKVLIHYDPDLPFARVIPDEAERNWFFANVCTHEWNIEQDRGRTWQEAEDLLIAEHPERAEQIRAFRKHWHEMVPHHYEDSVAITEKLIAEGRDVTLLTNFASDTFREAQERFPFLTKTRGVTVSGDIKLIKPDVAIYETHAKSFGLDPASTLFIDDSLANVEGAKAAGWNAVHFTGADKLRADLATFGIEV